MKNTIIDAFVDDGTRVRSRRPPGCPELAQRRRAASAFNSASAFADIGHNGAGRLATFSEMWPAN